MIIKIETIHKGLSAIKIKKRNHNDVGDMKISPDGKYAAYAAFDGGFYKVFLKRFEN